MTSTSEIYELLVSLISQCPQTVEILPGDDSLWMHSDRPGSDELDPSFAPFLFLEGNLGIPQKILYKVYLHAVGVFKSARSRVSTRPTTAVESQNPSNLDASLVRVLVASSSILLLANPSHQTALNARKHLVRRNLINLGTELRFIASLLSSQHCAKHAELWYHRRWLLTFSACNLQSSLADVTESHGHLQFTSQEALQGELELISRACEVYPRNYFAWAHRLICMRSLLSDYLAGTDDVGFVPVFRSEIARIKEWIDHHVSDYSAVHIILALSQAALQSGDLSLSQIIAEADLLDHAISLVQEYPIHETLWIYIWIAISISGWQQGELVQHFIVHFVQPLIQPNQPETGIGKGLISASQYARQFLSRVGYEFF